jgi:tetratricopeptide (TPR) repeat protein
MIRAQHLSYYLGFSERAEAGITGPDQVEWVARLNLEMDNVRLALDWAYQTDLDAGSQILSRLHENIDLQEGLQWARQFIQNPELQKPSLARARVLQTQADYFWTIEQFEPARAAAEESLELFRAHGDRIGEFGSLIELGGIYQFLEGMSRKSEFDHQALELARAMGDPLRQAVALADLGWDRRNHEQALRYWDEAVALLRQAGDWRDLAFLLGIYGDTVLANGDAETARPLLEEAMELSLRSNNKRSLEFVLIAKSRLALMSGNFKEAKSYLQEWIETADEMGNRMGYLWGRARLGYALIAEGVLEDGAEILSQTAREFHADRNRAGLAFALERLAHLFATSSLPERAAQLIGWADKTREDIGDVRPKLDQMNVDSDLAVCVSQLGEAQVKAAIDRGRTLTFDEAFALSVETG